MSMKSLQYGLDCVTVQERPDGSRRVAIDCSSTDASPDMAKQSFKDESDINVILRRYADAGISPHRNNFDAFFADVSAVPDYHNAFHVVEQASEIFYSLPADLRARFDNDPSKYLNFAMDSANHDEMIKLGMIEKPAEKPVDKPAV